MFCEVNVCVPELNFVGSKESVFMYCEKLFIECSGIAVRAVNSYMYWYFHHNIKLMVKTCFGCCSLCWGFESIFITRKEWFLYIGPSIKAGLHRWVQGLSLVFPAGTSWVGKLGLEHLLIKTDPPFRILDLRNLTCWTVPQIIIMFNVTHHHWKHILLVQYFLINSLGSRDVVFTLNVGKAVCH